MRSLAVKLTLAFLFISLSGTLLVALLVGWQTQKQFDRYIRERYADQITELSGQLQRYYQRTGSWDDVERVAIRDEVGPGQSNGGAAGALTGSLSPWPMPRGA